MEFPTRSDTNRAVQPRMMAIGVKFKSNLACLGRRGILYDAVKTNVIISCAVHKKQTAGFLMTWLIMSC